MTFSLIQFNDKKMIIIRQNLLMLKIGKSFINYKDMYIYLFIFQGYLKSCKPTSWVR